MRIVPWLAVACLAGCAVNGGDRQAPAVYDFGLPTAAVAASLPSARLALEVVSPPWMEALGVDYRLSYDDPLKQREYAGSRWAGTPGTLLAQRLAQRLGLPGMAADTASDCRIRFELQEFSQVFDSPRESRGLLYGRVSLIDSRRQAIAEQTLRIEKPASTADASGGVRALVAATDELGDRLADWLVAQEKKGTLARCRSAAGDHGKK